MRICPFRPSDANETHGPRSPKAADQRVSLYRARRRFPRSDQRAPSGSSAPAHEMHDLDRVVGGEHERCKGGAVVKDSPVALDDHGARVETERRKEIRKSPTGWDVPLCTVHSKNDLSSDR